MSLLTPALEARVLQAVEAAGRRPPPRRPPPGPGQGPADYVTNVDLAVQEISAGVWQS